MPAIETYNNSKTSHPRGSISPRRILIVSLVGFLLMFLYNDANTTVRRRCIPGVIYRAPGLKAIQKRSDLGTILEEKKFETGVEVGVQAGGNSFDILTRWKSCKSFALVDLWAHQQNYKDLANDKDHGEMERETREKLKDFSQITTFYKMKSIEAPIADNSLDFAYLDARHDYCAVKEDMEYYWPKLRPGGIMAGHDYIYNSEMIGAPQDWSICSSGEVQPGAVRGAVEEFAMKEGVTITVTYRDPQFEVFQTWIMQKPTIPECVADSLSP